MQIPFDDDKNNGKNTTSSAEHTDDKTDDANKEDDVYDVNKLNKNGDTALIVAARNGKMNDVKQLLSTTNFQN